MINLKPSDNPTLYYFVDDATLSVLVCNEFEDGNGYIYLGTSNNPKPKMAVAAFTQQGKITEGYHIRILD